MYKDVFISYSRKDEAIADKICAALDTAKISYFIDRQGISGGAKFVQVIVETIPNCKAFLYLASANSYRSKSVNRELHYASDETSIAILPYIIDNTVMPDGVKYYIGQQNIRNIKEHPIDTTLVDDICILVGKKRGMAIDISALETEETPEDIFKKGKKYYDKKEYKEAVK